MCSFLSKLVLKRWLGEVLKNYNRITMVSFLHYVRFLINMGLGIVDHVHMLINKWAWLKDDITTLLIPV